MSDDINEMFRQAGEALASSSPEVETVKRLVAEAKQLDHEIEQIEETLKAAKSRFWILKTKDLPDAMARMGSSAWKSEDGTITVEVKDFVSGSLPKPEDENDQEGLKRRQAAIRWVEEHDGAALLKTDVSLVFGRSEHNRALDLAGRLREEGFDVSVESGIHHQTLLAYVRERLKGGEHVDLEVLGLSSGRMAKFKFGAPTPRLHKEPKP